MATLVIPTVVSSRTFALEAPCRCRRPA
jgi:hypothetical protein